MSRDERPEAAIGHVSLRVREPQKTADYMIEFGLRPLVQNEELAVLELRGGTHLVLLKEKEPTSPGAKAPFDLMVDDIEAARSKCAALGFEPSDIAVGKIHSSFTLVEPGGHEITVNSSHASDRPV